MFYKIIEDKNSFGKIYVSKYFAEINSIETISSIDIQFGLKKCNSELKVLLDLSQDEIKLSKDIIELLLIPLDIQYQMNFNKDCINMGPVIGLLFNRTDKSLAKDLEFVRQQNGLSLEPPSGFSSFTTLPYPEIQGLIYVFSAEGISFESNNIKGFYYSPNSNDSNGKWKEGIFPIPTAIYKRAYISKSQVRKKLKELTGNKMFNSYWRDKWSFWINASKNLDVKNHLPYTQVYKGLDGLNEMLEYYKTVYIKLANGQLAHGLIKVTKSGDKYAFQRTFDIEPIVVNNKEQAASYLKRIMGKHSYLLQQGVETIRYEDRCTSFRIIMQKDETLQWKCTGICPRVGKPKGICSNYKPGLYNFTFESLLSKALQVDEEIVLRKKQEVIDICFRLCEISDATGENFGDIGIDIGIDESLKVWIFEINDGHRQHVTLKIGDINMYYKVKSNPIKYATGLCSFKCYETAKLY